MSETNQATEIARLKKINKALITRIEAGSSTHVAYDSFAHSVFLADKVRDRTSALNDALQELTQSNRQLVQAQAEAAVANPSRSKLMAAISHDIMQPVCAAKLLIATLAEQVDGTGNNKVLQATGQAISDIEGLLQSLLDYARHDIKESQPQLQATPLHDILQGLATESAPLANNKGLSFYYEPGNVIAFTEASILARILRNLISNAIRYTLEGNIKLTTSVADEQVIISVEDTGIGFQESYPKQILEPFQRSNNSTNQEGLGLGLANVSTLCQLLDHDLQYHSQLGRGSCFSIKLAAAMPSPNVTPAPLVKRTLAFAHRVLIVDNTLAICTALSSLLNTWGAHTDYVTNARSISATSIAAAEVILLDYHLGSDLTGLDIVSNHTITCPILFMTASDNPQDLQAIASAGYAYIKKPIRPAHLRQTLDTILAS